MPDPTAAEIAASEDAFTSLSDSEALDLAKNEFAEIVHAQLIPELDLAPDQAVDEYLGRYTALVTDDDAPIYVEPGEVNTNSLVESALPLRAPEGGTQRPLDAELEQQGDHFEADNSVVNAEIPAELEEGVEIPNADVTVTPTGTDQADAVPVADKVFYPNAAEDTDYMIAPTATGAEIFIQLRSEESPESFPIDLDMPDGATLQATDDGGAVVESDGETILWVDPPIAVDAAGAEVAVDYAIDGDQLSVNVPRDAASDYLYPIMVDPIYGVYDEYNWGQGGQSNVLNTDFWSWTSSNTNHYLKNSDGQAGGVGTIARGGHTYNAGSWGQWLAQPIGNSYIERVDFINMNQVRTNPGNPTVLALWTLYGGWVTSTVDYDDPGTPGGRVYPVSTSNIDQTQYGVSRTMWAGTSYTPDGAGGDAEAPDGSVGVFALTSNGGQRTNPGENLLKSAHIWRYDRYGPSAPSMVFPTPGNAWTDRYWFRVQDAGLGAKGIWIWGPNWTIPGTGSLRCSGAHQDPCPPDAFVEVNNLPEGRHDYTAMAVDPVLNGSAGLGFTAKIDRGGPDVNLSGPLWDRRNDYPQTLSGSSYGLSISATDGVGTTNPDTVRSGVKNLRVLVSGHVAHATPDQSCPNGSCPLSTTWTLNVANWEPGPQHIVVEATDHAGNTSQRDFWVHLPGDPGLVPGHLTESTCTIEPAELTQQEIDSLDLPDDTPIDETPDDVAPTQCDAPSAGDSDAIQQTLAGSDWKCWKITNYQRFDYPTGFYKAWLKYRTKVCASVNHEKVRSVWKEPSYDFSDAFSVDHNMQTDPYNAGQWHKYFFGPKGVLTMRAIFPIENCYGFSGACVDAPVALFNRADIITSSWWWWKAL